MKRYLLLISMLAAFVAESAAREVYRLNDDWTFYFRSENSADDARNITLPHTWNLDALAGNSEYQRTTGNYMRRLYIPADWASKRLFLRFDGVQTVADVFVNGYHVGEHRGVDAVVAGIAAADDDDVFIFGVKLCIFRQFIA